MKKWKHKTVWLVFGPGRCVHGIYNYESDARRCVKEVNEVHGGGHHKERWRLSRRLNK